METDLPILEKPPTEPPAQPPSRKISQPTTKVLKLQSTQPPTRIINDVAKTFNIFPPISPVPERSNQSEPIRRTFSVTTPRKITPSKGSKDFRTD